MNHTKYNIAGFVAVTFIACLFFCCRKEVKNDPGESSITIIIKSPKPQHDTLFLDNGITIETMGAPVLSFRGDTAGNPIHPVERIKDGDTLTINTLSEAIVVSYRYGPVSSMDFVVHNGDSVVVEEKDGFPHFRILNRQYADFDLNHDIHKIERYGLYRGFRNQDFFIRPDLIMILEQRYNRQAIVDEYRKKYLAELLDEKKWLDSLNNTGHFSAAGYDFFDARNNYIRKNIYLDSDSIGREEIKGIVAEYDESLLDTDRWGFEEAYYRHAVNKYYLMDGTTPADAFKKIDDDGLIKGKMNLSLKLGWFNYIVNRLPSEVGKKYYDLLLAEIADTTLLARFKDRYATIFDEKLMHSDQLELADKNGNRTTLAEIIKKHEGHVVYVDFWASWCQPCLAEMPSSQKLRDEYLGKNVVFIYLALNDDKKAWENALPKAELGNHEYSYFIENSRTAPFIKELNISAIPRYLLFDSTGKLALSDAPRPSSSEIRRAINDLLK